MPGLGNGRSDGAGLPRRTPPFLFYLSLAIFSPSALARSRIDSSLRVSARASAFSAIPLATSRWSLRISSEVHACRCRSNRSAISSDGDDQAVINEVERGEDYLKDKFTAALNSGHLSGESRAVVERAYQSVLKGHDQVSAIKHGLEASA